MILAAVHTLVFAAAHSPFTTKTSDRLGRIRPPSPPPDLPTRRPLTTSPTCDFFGHTVRPDLPFQTKPRRVPRELRRSAGVLRSVRSSALPPRTNPLTPCATLQFTLKPPRSDQHPQNWSRFSFASTRAAQPGERLLLITLLDNDDILDTLSLSSQLSSTL